MTESRKLGRGIESLMVDAAELMVRREVDGHQSQPISTNLIFPNEQQPRKEFDAEKMQRLMASVRANGFLEPIVVRQVQEGFEIVVGERRWRAAVELGLDTIPAIIRDVPDEKMLELALAENIHREDLNPIERAEAYTRFMKEFGLTQEQAADRLQVDRAVLANTVRLLSLPEEVKGLIASGKLAASHGRAIAGVERSDDQVRLARRCVEEGLSARALESLLKRRKSKPGPAASQKALPPVLRDLEDRLRRHFGTRVTLQPSQGRRGKGKLIVEYYGEEELGRIVARLGLPSEA